MDTSELLSFNFNYWILQTIAIFVTALLIPRLRITSIFGALFTVVALAFINSKVWDAALFFHIPDSFNTQAIMLLITNGIIFWLVVKFLPGIEIDGFLPAIIAPVVFTVFSLLIGEYAKDIDWVNILDSVIGVLEHVKTYFQSSMPEMVNEVAVSS